MFCYDRIKNRNFLENSHFSVFFNPWHNFPFQKVDIGITVHFYPLGNYNQGTLFATISNTTPYHDRGRMMTEKHGSLIDWNTFKVNRIKSIVLMIVNSLNSKNFLLTKYVESARRRLNVQRPLLRLKAPIANNYFLNIVSMSKRNVFRFK